MENGEDIIYAENGFKKWGKRKTAGYLCLMTGIYIITATGLSYLIDKYGLNEGLQRDIPVFGYMFLFYLGLIPGVFLPLEILRSKMRCTKEIDAEIADHYKVGKIDRSRYIIRPVYEYAVNGKAYIVDGLESVKQDFKLHDKIKLKIDPKFPTIFRRAESGDEDSVTAEIVDCRIEENYENEENIKVRPVYEYSYNNKTYRTTSYSGDKSIGEKGTKVKLRINPDHPREHYIHTNKLEVIVYMVIGIAMMIPGLITLATVLFSIRNS